MTSKPLDRPSLNPCGSSAIATTHPLGNAAMSGLAAKNAILAAILAMIIAVPPAISQFYHTKRNNFIRVYPGFASGYDTAIIRRKFEPLQVNFSICFRRTGALKIVRNPLV